MSIHDPHDLGDTAPIGNRWHPGTGAAVPADGGGTAVAVAERPAPPVDPAPAVPARRSVRDRLSGAPKGAFAAVAAAVLVVLVGLGGFAVGRATAPDGGVGQTGVGPGGLVGGGFDPDGDGPQGFPGGGPGQTGQQGTFPGQAPGQVTGQVPGQAPAQQDGTSDGTAQSS